MDIEVEVAVDFLNVVCEIPLSEIDDVEITATHSVNVTLTDGSKKVLVLIGL